jgi:hypothetical protein
MNNLKLMVIDLFGTDQQMRTLEKEIKVKTAQYYKHIQKNTENAYSDKEVMDIYQIHTELLELKDRQENMQNKIGEIKNDLKKFVLPLNGGSWIHETEEEDQPVWEFWLEEDELKFARLKG